MHSSSGGGGWPLRGLEGDPGLPGAPQDEAGLTRMIISFESIRVVPLSSVKEED